MRKTILLLPSMVTTLLLAGVGALVGLEDPARATLPQDPGKIAFVSDRDGSDWDIYTMNPDGSGILHIDRPGDQFYPTVSPDGTRIAYHVTSREREGVYVMNSDGSGQDLLVFDNKSGTVDFAHLDWSPDGKKLVAMGYRPECQLPCDNWRYDIYTMNSDGTGQPTNLTNTKGTGEGFPSWSSTGKIAFESSYAVESAEYYSNPHSDIYEINPDGTGRTNLTNTADRERPSPPTHPMVRRSRTRPLLRTRLIRKSSG